MCMPIIFACLICVGDYNIISVDWKPLAVVPFYFYASRNAKLVGELAAEFVSFLTNLYDTVTLDSFHVIGMSLGAQVVGPMGYYLNGQLPRITGLDPAGK